MMRIIRRDTRGYSFVELLVVTTIILVLASAIMPLAKVTMRRQRATSKRFLAAAIASLLL